MNKREAIGRSAVTAALTAGWALAASAQAQSASHTLVVRTTPSGAAVEMTDGTRCTSPCTLDMTGKRSSVATITVLAYKPVQAPVTIDASGAVQPNPIDVRFVKEDPGGAAPLPANGEPAGGR